jgi:hypothetical protein
MTLLALAALALLYVVVPILGDVYARYHRSRTVRCPETGSDVTVQDDAAHAVRTALPGPPEVRIRACTLWPGRRECAQHCTAQI